MENRLKRQRYSFIYEDINLEYDRSLTSKVLHTNQLRSTVNSLINEHSKRRTPPISEQNFFHRQNLGHMVIGFKQVRVPSGNLVPSPSAENHLLSLSGLADRK